MKNRRAIVISDDSSTVAAVRAGCARLGAVSYVLSALSPASNALASDIPASVIVIESILGDGTVLDFMAKRGARLFDTPVIVVVRPDAIGLATEAMKRGAAGCLAKPFSDADVADAIHRAVTGRRDARRDRNGHVHGHGRHSSPFLGTSGRVRDLAAEVARVCRADAPVLIDGETGTGKGFLARWIHHHGPRAAGPFVDVNCASLAKELFESEMYGFEKGAFTGAIAGKVGLIEAADGGTMFLDEIGDLDINVQPRLLKVIEDKRFRRLGSVRERQCDVRFVAASNRNLLQLVNERSFRQDLLFRMNTLTLTCPPLRHRIEDLPDIALHLLRSVALDLEIPPLTISPEAMTALQSYSWPGNIRELHHVIQRAALICSNDVIQPADLRLGDREGVSLAPLGGGDFLTLEAMEVRHIRAVLEAEDWNVERAAQRLAMPRSTLYLKIRTHRLR